MIEMHESKKEQLSNFITSINQIIELAGEEPESKFRVCDRLKREPLKPAIDRYLETFAETLQIIYN